MSSRDLTKFEHELAGLEESFKRRAVDDLMQDLKFRSNTAREDFKDAVSSRVNSGFGTYYGPKNETLADFVQSEYEERHWLHPTKPAAQTPSAESAQPATPKTKEPSVNIEDISPSMSAEQLAAAWRAIRDAVKK